MHLNLEAFVLVLRIICLILFEQSIIGIDILNAL